MGVAPPPPAVAVDVEKFGLGGGGDGLEFGGRTVTAPFVGRWAGLVVCPESSPEG